MTAPDEVPTEVGSGANSGARAEHPRRANAEEPAGERRERCSDAARLRGDPLIGTAPPATRWLLVEQDGGWGREALTSLDAPASVRSHLERALSESGARLQLVRRPGRRSPVEAAGPRRWFVVDVHPAGVVADGTLDEGWAAVTSALHTPPAELPAVEAEQACPPADNIRRGLSGGLGPAREAAPARRFILVCTNGRHDVCCAVRGRPVAAALATMWPDDVWECTHTGGDRFAGNVVVLPDGVVYGSLDPGSAMTVIDAHSAGRLTCGVLGDHLRGFVGFRATEQAARAALAPRLAELDVTPWERERLRVENARDGSGWICKATLDGAPFATVTGHDEIRPAQHLTCSATAVSRARVPVVDAVKTAR